MSTNTPYWAETGLQWLLLVQHELLLFSAFWLIAGALDEIVMDLVWLWLRLRGDGRAARLPEGLAQAPLSGPAAVFVPAWQEAAVIGIMVSHTLLAWGQRDYVLYVGCYRNDPLTPAAARAAGAGDPRLRVVIVDADGPTTKADCLNRLYAVLCADECASGVPYRSIVIQDAEDMVHPAGLAAIDAGLEAADFVQLPVRPELQPRSRWIAGHYADEFREAHGKDLVVRDALGAAIPAAGVDYGFARHILAALADGRRAGAVGPFAADSLTEDYELGLLVTQLGGKGRFLRLRDAHGDLVATRSYFPDSFEPAIRQKARWIHGIAFQGWDRLGWSGRLVDRWMALRDRRGPWTALVLAIAYLLIALEGLIGFARLLGLSATVAPSPLLTAMIAFCFGALLWRAVFRFAFTGSDYGWAEGLRAVLRIPVANFIAILAGRRAVFAYVRSLRGASIGWDKTEHRLHPARPEPHQAEIRPA